LLEALLSSSTQPCHIWPLPRPVSVSFCFPTVSALAIQKAVKRLRPRIFVGLDNIPDFIIKGCSAIWVPALKYLFHFTVSQKHFLTQWKQAVIAPVYKKTIDTYRFLLTFQVFEHVTHDHLSYYFKCKLNLCQHGSLKPKSTVTNLITYLKIIYPH
jgi:hypothetical protein